MKASIVIPSRGGRERLPRLLRALEAQTHQDWEAIVVIDGDIDGSAEVVDRFQHLPVRAIVLPENKGRVTALNTGFAAATGDVLIRADDDFEPSPGHVAAHVAAHQGEACGAVGLPRNIAPDNAYMRAYGKDADEKFREYAYALPAAERWRLWGGNVSVTRDTYEKVGGYDTSYKGYGWEDVDFGYRVHQLGLPIKLLPDAEVRHHMAAVTTKIRVSRAFDSGKARAHFDRLHADASGAAITRPRGLWNRLVVGYSRILNRARSERLGAMVDHCLPALPGAIGRKLVAGHVEASALAGHSSAREQKATRFQHSSPRPAPAEAGVSVIMPCYNGAATLPLALEALSRQVDAPPFELIIVDNNSTDDSRSVAMQWASRLPLRIVAARAHQGVSFARNVGIDAAGRPFVAICDADDVVSRFWLRDMARALDTHDAVSGAALDVADAEFTSVERVWEIIGDDGEYRDPPRPVCPERYPIFMGGNCAMLRELSLYLNGFDQSYTRGSDDVDFAFRLNASGVAIAHSPVMRIGYRDRSTPRSALRHGFHRGFMHARLCARFNYWGDSPHLEGQFWSQPLRALLAMVLMAVGVKKKDWLGVSARLGATSGLVWGYVVHRVAGRVPPRMLGLGLKPATSDPA